MFLKLIVENSQKKIYPDYIQLTALFNEIQPAGECEGSYHVGDLEGDAKNLTAYSKSQNKEKSLCA